MESISYTNDKSKLDVYWNEFLKGERNTMKKGDGGDNDNNDDDSDDEEEYGPWCRTRWPSIVQNQMHWNF